MEGPVDEAALNRELGEIESEILQLKNERLEIREELKEVREDLKEVVRILTEAKGSWKTLAIIATGAATFGGLVATIIPLF